MVVLGEVGDEGHGHAHVDARPDGDGEHGQEQGPPGAGAGLVEVALGHGFVGLQMGRGRERGSGWAGRVRSWALALANSREGTRGRGCSWLVAGMAGGLLRHCWPRPARQSELKRQSPGMSRWSTIPGSWGLGTRMRGRAYDGSGPPPEWRHE